LFAGRAASNRAVMQQLNMSGSAYQVGRNRPPVSTRFKKGQSGNPSGRPKQQPSFRSELLAELGQLAPGADGQPISKQQALIRKLLELALGGNLRAMNVIFAYLQRVPEPHDAYEELSESDLRILKHLEEREHQGVDRPNGGKDPPE
jgi:hypothetical protein